MRTWSSGHRRRSRSMTPPSGPVTPAAASAVAQRQPGKEQTAADDVGTAESSSARSSRMWAAPIGQPYVQARSVGLWSGTVACPASCCRALRPRHERADALRGFQGQDPPAAASHPAPAPGYIGGHPQQSAHPPRHSRRQAPQSSTADAAESSGDRSRRIRRP